MARSYSQIFTYPQRRGCLGANKEVVATSPAWLGHLTCPLVGKELFQPGAANGMRSNTCTKAEEHGRHELFYRSCRLDQGSSFLHHGHPMPSAPVCWLIACDRFSSTSLMLFLFHMRCEDLGWSRPATGGSREAGGFALCCCAAILISRPGILLANMAAA